jgi:cytochrome c oxidase subunit 2
MPDASAQHAASLDVEFHWTLLDCAIAFIAAQLVLAAIVWKTRQQYVANASSSSAAVRIAIIIAVVFVGLELVSAGTLGRKSWASMYSSDLSSEPIRVETIGQQFAFYFRYPGRDGRFGPIHMEKIDASIGNYFGLDRAHDADSKDDVVSAELVLPVGRQVELLLESQDVIHSFYVRELRVQQDMVPGMRIPVHFTPSRTGKYEIVCTQLCGLGHYRMRAYLEVVSETNFERWIQTHAH